MTRTAAVALLMLSAGLIRPGLLLAQQPRIDDPVPPDAKRIVRPVSGDIRTIQGLSSQVAGRAESLASALAALGARTTDTEIRINMSADVLFDFDKAAIKKAAEPELQKVVTVLTSYPQATVNVEGYTDAKGSDAYNQKLSERRAEAVRAWLAGRPGLGGLRFTTVGRGASNPVAPNKKPDGSDDPEGRQKNRRVEIVVSKR